MNMVEGVLLVVDSYEGTMPQTRFVLKKALEANVKPIVVINKVDKPTSRVNEVVDDIQDETPTEDETLFKLFDICHYKLIGISKAINVGSFHTM